MRVSASVDYTPWTEFLETMDWRQGEHVSIIAPTGVGKSVIMTELQRMRAYVLAVAVKPTDDTMEQLKKPTFGKY